MLEEEKIQISSHRIWRNMMDSDLQDYKKQWQT
jgi:hypothetical protein